MAHEASRIIALYERNAAGWEADRGRDLIEGKWVGRFADLLLQGADVLDLGCGSGDPIGRCLIDRGFGYQGVDSSPSLIGICRKKFPSRVFHVADMRTLDLGRAFEGLIAWDSMIHLSPTDLRKLFSILAAHVAPGGILMFTSGPCGGESLGEWRGEPLYHGSLGRAENQALLDAHGFSLIEHMRCDPDCGDHTVWIARRL